jgi:hypothetical protein
MKFLKGTYIKPTAVFIGSLRRKTQNYYCQIIILLGPLGPLGIIHLPVDLNLYIIQYIF